MTGQANRNRSQRRKAGMGEGRISRGNEKNQKPGEEM